MSENLIPFTIEQQIRYCEEEAARWQHFKAKARTAARWADAKVRRDYYHAIVALLQSLQETAPITEKAVTNEQPKA